MPKTYRHIKSRRKNSKYTAFIFSNLDSKFKIVNIFTSKNIQF